MRFCILVAKRSRIHRLHFSTSDENHGFKEFAGCVMGRNRIAEVEFQSSSFHPLQERYESVSAPSRYRLNNREYSQTVIGSQSRRRKNEYKSVTVILWFPTVINDGNARAKQKRSFLQSPADLTLNPLKIYMFAFILIHFMHFHIIGLTVSSIHIDKA